MKSPQFGPPVTWKYVLWIAAIILGVAVIKYLTWVTMH